MSLRVVLLGFLFSDLPELRKEGLSGVFSQQNKENIAAYTLQQWVFFGNTAKWGQRWRDWQSLACLVWQEGWGGYDYH